MFYSIGISLCMAWVGMSFTKKKQVKKWGLFLKIPQFMNLCLITQTHNFEALIWVMPKAFYVRQIWKRPDVLDFCGYFLARGLTIISATFHVMLISVKFQAMVILVAFQRPPLSGACHDLRERERGSVTVPQSRESIHSHTLKSNPGVFSCNLVSSSPLHKIPFHTVPLQCGLTFPHCKSHAEI